MLRLDAHGIVVVDSTFSECRASTLMGPTAVSGHSLRSIISSRNVAHQLALVFVPLSARERVLFFCFSRVSRLASGSTETIRCLFVVGVLFR